MESKKLLPIGTKVFDVRYGWGEIRVADNKEVRRYEYEVYFKYKDTDGGGFLYSYDIEGYVQKGTLTPILSLTEYTLKDGGFTPITDFDFDAPKVGDVGYFWDKEEQFTLSYSRIKEILKYGFLNQNKTEWRYFSKEVPQWFKDKMSDQ